MWPFKESDTPKINPIKEHSSNIFRKANEDADAVRKFSEDKSVDQSKYGLSDVEWIAVFCECQNFYLHLTDRFICGHLSEARRSELMNELERLTIWTSADVICEGWPPDMIKKIKNEWWQNFQLSMQEYAQHKMFSEKGDPKKDTLFWEFGKRIAELSGYGMSIIYIMLGSELAFNALKQIEFKRFVEKVR